MKKTMIATLLVALCLSAASAQQQKDSQPAARPRPAADPHAGHAAHNSSPAEPTAAQQWFSDVELLDQDGRKLRFYSDVLKGKTVVVNAFFTTCTSVCPPMNHNMMKVQEAFGDRVGRDVFFVSISVDPETDTPPRLKEYASRYKARAGWTFLTGKKENVDWALYKLGQYVEQREQHTNIFIIGNERTGLWKKAFGLAQADELVKIVQSVLEDKPANTTTPGGK